MIKKEDSRDKKMMVEGAMAMDGLVIFGGGGGSGDDDPVPGGGNDTFNAADDDDTFNAVLGLFIFTRSRPHSRLQNLNLLPTTGFPIWSQINSYIFNDGCGVCTIIRHGFQSSKASGIRTTASSGRAHDCLDCKDGRRAMLVCRVIAGRVKHATDVVMIEEEDGVDLSNGSSYDSVASCGNIYSNLEELYVFNPRAILPCFVVIYKALESY
ncbi:nucleic acid binding [Olea europaea subsp. europaea]|uniref:Nucleic acid binding n=1 Tax=Olea europaea subsp. europaea TaxID=158383 RepID=A0A8S0VGX4_OLEEU|nr:nucleic acid binding [Olea europaea subsp. europaea]